MSDFQSDITSPRRGKKDKVFFLKQKKVENNVDPMWEAYYTLITYANNKCIDEELKKISYTQ